MTSLDTYLPVTLFYCDAIDFSAQHLSSYSRSIMSIVKPTEFLFSGHINHIDDSAYLNFSFVLDQTYIIVPLSPFVMLLPQPCLVVTVPAHGPNPAKASGYLAKLTPIVPFKRPLALHRSCL